ncbi:MAG: PAS domain-containing sensor histidine kinase [Caldilineaceae bacterium]
MVPDTFIILNEQYQIVFGSRSLLAALGCQSLAEVAGQHFAAALHCAHACASSDDRHSACGGTEFCRECGVRRAISRGLRGVEDVQECRLTLADGTPLDLRISSCPFRSDGHRYVLLAAADISHEKQRRVIERTFFHDILNTAGGLAGMAELLCTGTPEEVEECKETIALLANSLVDAIQAQQMLAAAECGDLRLDPAPVNSLALLNEVRSAYLGHEVCSGRQIEVDPSAAAVIFTSDTLLLRRVLGNLLKYALETCAPGATVTLTCRSTSDGVEFAVHRPGSMSHSAQLQVFERPFSTRGDGRGTGTYSSKLMVERYLGGSVACDSTSEHGTTLRAFIPNRTAKAEARAVRRMGRYVRSAAVGWR